MNRRMWTGILAGVLAATVLLGVAGGAYRAGQRQEVVTRAVGDGQVVRVIDGGGYGYGWGHGPGFGFFLFPLVVVVLVVALARGRRRSWGAGPGGWGGGACRPGESFEDRHRRVHADGVSSVAPPPNGPSEP